MQRMDRESSPPFQSAAGRRIVADPGMDTNQDRWNEALVESAGSNAHESLGGAGSAANRRA